MSTSRARKWIRRILVASALVVAGLGLWLAAEIDLLPRGPWSIEHRALASLGRATSVEVLSIEWLDSSPGFPAAIAGSQPDVEAACHRSFGITGHQLHGCAVLTSSADVAAIRRLLAEWLTESRRYAWDEAVSACAPEYRHAVSWSEGGHRYDVLMCFECGHYTVLVDASEPGWSPPWRTPPTIAGEAELNRFLRDAGIRHYDNELDGWIPGDDENVPVDAEDPQPGNAGTQHSP